MKIHVGNLAPETKKEDLEKAFATFGPVTSVDIIADKDTGKSRGYGFVEMANAEEGAKAITGMHEKELNGNALAVTEARKKPESAAK